MKNILLIDFGSTYTKITAVDVENQVLLGTASAYTTVATDINDGLYNALSKLKEATGLSAESFSETYACSSAAGGLRMITSGLVPELTAEAARLASLGAGAKVIGVYSYQLTEEDISQIDSLCPDIFLLTGGTDGGNSDCILNNAKMLANTSKEFPIVIAGNRSCAKQCANILSEAGKEVHISKNVMPRFNELSIEDAQGQIREIFLKRIVQAKGLSKVKQLVEDILMPTPAAMMKAMELLSSGYEEESGLGDLIAVDLGGATTDVYSIADGFPTNANTIIKGLPEPHSKRTVEGDIGMRYSIHGIVEAVGINHISYIADIPIDRCIERIDFLSEHTDYLPQNKEDEALDFALAASALSVAVTRHAGSIEQVYTPMGLTFSQTGKDLTGVSKVVATGGAIIHTKKTHEIVSHIFASEKTTSLRPKTADIFIDRKYILASMGLLSTHYPKAALRIMKKELTDNGITE